MTRSSVLVLGLFLSTLAAACGGEDAAADPGGRFDEVVKSDKGKGGDAGKTPDSAATSEEDDTSPDETSPDEPPAPVAPVGTPNTCSTARDLGALSGDTGTPSTSAHGKCSEWVRLRVTENYSGLNAGPMNVTATLISPDKEDFDLFVYVNAEADLLECTTVNQKSDLPTGRSDVVKVQWGEQYTFNNSDDSRTVSFEVKKKGGGCSTQEWALLVQGNY